MKTINSPIRLGLLGCGIAARDLHWPAIKQLPNKITVTRVCNHTAPKAQAMAELAGEFYGTTVPFETDMTAFVQRDDIDAVVVMLPVQLNEEAARLVLGAGKHLFLEKPLAHTLESAKSIVNNAKNHPRLVAMVAENFRYRRVYLELAELLRKGAIGKPFHVEWRVWQKIVIEENKYAQTQWRINHQYEGGFVTDAGVHNIAALRDVFGNLTLEGAQTSCVNPLIGRTDALAYLFSTSGTPGIPSLTGYLHMAFSAGGENRNELRVLGDSGSILIEDGKLTVGGATTDYEDQGGYLDEYLAFIEALEGQRDESKSLQRAYDDLQTMLKAVGGA